ncbi:MAG: hypothetical protein ACLT9S_03505 [Faecalibacterium sp.]
MEQLLICMSLSLIAGLLASRAAKAVRLPAVTSYLVAGLLLGPFFLGRLGLSGWGFGFGSLAQVESYGIITQVALGFHRLCHRQRVPAQRVGEHGQAGGHCGHPAGRYHHRAGGYRSGGPALCPYRMSSQWHRPSRWVPSPLPQPLPPP